MTILFIIIILIDISLFIINGKWRTYNTLQLKAASVAMLVVGSIHYCVFCVFLSHGMGAFYLGLMTWSTVSRFINMRREAEA